MDALFNAKRTKLLTIVGPVGTRLRVMDTLGCLYPGAPAKAENLLLRFIEFKDRESLAVGPLGVLPIPVVHPSGSTAYGLRVSVGGRVVAFSGDTAWTPALIDIARDADLFICECHGFDTPEATHLHYKELRPAIPAFKARRTILTHLGTAMLANLGAVDLEVAEDGQTIML
jgi:ribonuclease BN (tRNA processing enzyme)